MSAPTQPIDKTASEIHAVLARLRTARTVDPDHDRRRLINAVGRPAIHVDCGVCTAENRLNWLLDKLRKQCPAFLRMLSAISGTLCNVYAEPECSTPGMSIRCPRTSATRSATSAPTPGASTGSST